MSLPEFFKQRHDTTVLWSRAAGQNFNIGVVKANNSGHTGEIFDFGVDFPQTMMYLASYRFATLAPTGGPLFLHWLHSHDNVAFQGIGSFPAVNTAINGAVYRNVALILPILATLPTTNDVNGSYTAGGVFHLPARYGVPLLFNLSGGSTTNNNSAFVLRMAPLDTQVRNTQ